MDNREWRELRESVARIRDLSVDSLTHARLDIKTRCVFAEIARDANETLDRVSALEASESGCGDRGRQSAFALIFEFLRRVIHITG